MSGVQIDPGATAFTLLAIVFTPAECNQYTIRPITIDRHRSTPALPRREKAGTSLRLNLAACVVAAAASSIPIVRKWLGSEATKRFH
jgi:hypothetical protein